MELLSTKEIEKLNSDERKRYFNNFREASLKMHVSNLHIGSNIIELVGPKLRNFEFFIEGEENIPKNVPVVFGSNHSNSHDIFIGYEVLAKLGIRGSIMVAKDCLNPFTINLFRIAGSTLLDRRIKKSRQHSMMEMNKRMCNKQAGWIFVEGTWNLFPGKVNQEPHVGIVNIASATDGVMIPVSMLYKERPGIITKEKDLYIDCKVRFGKPIVPDPNKTPLQNIAAFKEAFDELRKEHLKENKMYYESIDQVPVMEYLDHTIIKMFKALGFKFRQTHEAQFLQGTAKTIPNVHVMGPNGKLRAGFLPDMDLNRLKDIDAKDFTEKDRKIILDLERR